jgi:hypothetical protein
MNVFTAAVRFGARTDTKRTLFATYSPSLWVCHLGGHPPFG